MSNTVKRLVLLLGVILSPVGAFPQENVVSIDYNRPQKYIVAGVNVEGNTYFTESQIIQQTGLEKGMELTVPGEDVSNIVRRLWLQRKFEDIAFSIDSLTAGGDSAYFRITVMERPRVSGWTFTGVKTGDKKELMDRLHLRRGGEFSEYVEKTSIDIIKRYFAEKGFLKTEVKAEVQKDTVVRRAVKVNFAVNKGERYASRP